MIITVLVCYSALERTELKCLNETHNTVCEGKYLFDTFKIDSGFNIGAL
jgi:hypothetical protein